MNLRGNVDMLTRAEIRGWAVDLDQPGAPVTVQLIVDGRLIASARADTPRSDLGALGIPSPNIGFAMGVPAGIRFDLSVAEVRIAGTNGKLPGMVEAARYEGVLEQISGTLITGWAWHSWLPDERVDVLVRNNQQVIGRVTADRRRPDLLSAGMGDGRYGFEFELRKLPEWHRIDTAAVTCAFEPTGAPLYDLRQGAARAPVSVNSSRALYSAKAPAEPLAPPAAPIPAAVQPAPPPPPAQPAAPAAEPAPDRASVWRARRSQRPAPVKPAPVQLVKFIQQAPEKPMSPELLEAMRDALNFGEDDPFV